MLSDVDSEVIKRYGILNDGIQPGEGFLYGIPFPGSFVTNSDGVVVAKFFHDSYKKRDSPELMIGAALGQTVLSDEGPRATSNDAEVNLTVALHGGKGKIRLGMRREIVARFELSDGLHLYGEPVPEGMVPTRVKVSGPPGLVVEDTQAPPTTPLRLLSLDAELSVWSGVVDLRVPIYATSELTSDTRSIEGETIDIDVEVQYQACNDTECLLPRTKKFSLTATLDVIDVPGVKFYRDIGQREPGYDGAPHVKRLVLRRFLRNPIKFIQFVAMTVRLHKDHKRRVAAGESIER